MTEHQLERLDELFPNGWVIVYVARNGDIRLARSNEERHFTIDQVHDMVADRAEDVQVELDLESDSQATEIREE